VEPLEDNDLVSAGEASDPRNEITGRISERIKESGWDGLVILGVENVQYASGAWLAYAKAYLDRPNCIVWPTGGPPTYIAGAELIDGIKPLTTISAFVGYEERGAKPPAVIADTVADVIRAEGMGEGRIGLEMLRTSIPFFQRLTSLLPKATFEPADDMLRSLRMVKTKGEIALLREVAMRQDSAVATSFNQACAGQTERELGLAIQKAVLDAGCSVTELMVGSGDGARVLGAPSERILAPGDLVRLDLSSLREGYFADEGRVAVVGSPTRSQLEFYKRQLELRQSVMDSIEPGRRCDEVHRRYLSEAARIGVELFEYPYIGVGHGIGINGDEYPKLNRGDETVIEVGMVLNVEPDIFGPEREILHVEDMVLVGSRGVEVLTSSRDWSQLPVINADSLTVL
jgi:Xaa-Pro aminopeptidase